MASTKLMTTKDGRRFYKISVSRGYGKSPYSTRWYVPEKMTAKRTIERELERAVRAFEQRCENEEEPVSRAEKAEAEAKARAEAAKIKTLRQYAESVFMPSKAAIMSENGRASYQMFLDRHIFPALGDVPLLEIKPAMVKKLLLDFQKKGYAHATCVKLYNILNGLFDMAFLDDSIPVSPMLKVKRPAPRKNEPIKEESEKAFTAAELAKVLSCVAEEPLKWQVYINLAADTGARRGELCALQWQDIDWTNGTVTIRRNLQYSAQMGVYETSPKNGKSRSVDVGPETLSLLRQLREDQAKTCISQWLFTQDGTALPMHPQSPTRYFKRFGERYGIVDFHPHKLRHSSASIAITSGADVVSVSRRLGHSDPSVTLRMYAHSNEESIRRAGQIVREALKAQNE